MKKIIEKIMNCRTMTQLNLIRDEVFDAMNAAETNEDRLIIQKAFRRQNNRIKIKIYGKEVAQ
ncbi:MAG: hypothetical protein K6F23_14930 [Solobacterium sp.]|nr:hypothetical protein [Solobacterium sp.]